MFCKALGWAGEVLTDNPLQPISISKQGRRLNVLFYYSFSTIEEIYSTSTITISRALTLALVLSHYTVRGFADLFLVSFCTFFFFFLFTVYIIAHVSKPGGHCAILEI